MKTIMTVDDSASVRQMVKFVPRDGGYEVVEAMDGCFLTDLNMKQQGKAAGATGWIVKPFTPDQLLAVAKKVMR